jgi:GNAT superfamily N-acetyltransferase
VASDHPNACEKKRLFVRTAFRGFGLGRLLVDATVAHARLSGYSNMLLYLFSPPLSHGGQGQADFTNTLST